jgi:predicted RNA-binding Zn ribbon-like protein
MESEAPFTGLARARGPGALGVLQDFLNTADIESETDLVATPSALAAWLTENGLLGDGEKVSALEHGRALDLRERLRDALEARTHGATSPSAEAHLNHIAAGVPLRIRFEDAARLEPAQRRAAPALGPILATVYDAMRDESVSRLKVCRNEGCRWAFFDTSRNRSGAWCSMAICGNRQKGRVYRRRHAGDR